jgi:hypothetical protein
MYETKMKLLKDMEDFIINKIGNKKMLPRWKYAIEDLGGYEKIANNDQLWCRACRIFGAYCEMAGVFN